MKNVEKEETPLLHIERSPLFLLIAILIALGCNVSPSSTEAELKARNPGQYDRAVQIYQNQDFTIDGGGVVIVETGGD
mgnify:CR=1 FL=1